MASDEDESPAEVRLGALNREVKHIPRHVRHQHVADDGIEIQRHNFPKALRTIAHRGNDEIVSLEQERQRLSQILIVIEEQDSLDIEIQSLGR